MNLVLPDGVPQPSVPASLAQRYGRIAAALLLITLVAGSAGELFIPSKLIVSRSAAATAHNIVTSGALFRVGFAAYLVEAVCDVALSLFFYLLLRPVRRDVSLLAAFFGLVSTAVYATAELFYFAASLFLSGADYLRTFSPAQLETLALFSLKLYGAGGGIFLIFYGIASTLRGYLIFRSGYLPRFLGALLALGGLSFILANFLLVLAPAAYSDFLLTPMALAVIALTVWLLVKGVDVEKWQHRLTSAA